MKLELKKFNPSNIRSDSVVVFIGKRGVGKSVALKDVMSFHKNIPVGVVISPTEQANNYFEKFIPKMLIYDEYETTITSKFIERQINITKQKNNQIKKNGTSDIDNRAFIILDDCLYDAKTWCNDKNIRSLFLNGRHYSIFFLITMQFCLGLPPILRSNIDYVFIFRNNIIREREKIYNHYAGMFPSFDVFNTVMDACTENFECLVIDYKIQSNKLTDQVFWYKAIPKDFKMCNEELWNLCAIEEQKKESGLYEDDADEQFDPNFFAKNRNKIKLNVHKKN